VIRRKGRSDFYRLLVVTLSVALIAQSSIPTATAQTTAGIKIVIVQGEGAVNNVRQRVAREPIVEVQDENNRPVVGALVLFTLPERGASGVFADGSHTMSVITDTQGRAIGTGLKPNNVGGNFQIRVDATYQNQTASASISQSNAGGGGGMSGTGIAALVGIAAAAAAGAIALVGRDKNKAPSPTTISVAPGTVGRPQ
jgi:hypothetical protein